MGYDAASFFEMLEEPLGLPLRRTALVRFFSTSLAKNLLVGWLPSVTTLYIPSCFVKFGSWRAASTLEGRRIRR